MKVRVRQRRRVAVSSVVRRIVLEEVYLVTGIMQAGKESSKKSGVTIAPRGADRKSEYDDGHADLSSAVINGE